MTLAGGPANWRHGPFLPPGSPITIDNCAQEALHHIGGIQPVGVLVAAGPDGVIRAISQNATAALGVESSLLGRSVAEVFPELEAGIPAQPVIFTTAGGPTELCAHHTVEGDLVVELCPPTPSIPDLDPAAITIGALEAFGAAASVADLVEAAVEHIRRIYGFDRVWVYRFAADGHGEIIAESTDDEARFLGLHYPAADIPTQARAMFLEDPVRVIHDVAGETIPIEQLATDSRPVDLTLATLRGVSEMHRTYLANLDVGASMSLALKVEGRLWGLVSCHHYGTAHPLSHSMRRVGAVLSNLLSLQIASLEGQARAEWRLEVERSIADLVAEVAGSTSVLDGLGGAGAPLLKIVDAEGAVISIGGRRASIGRIPDEHTVERLFDHLTSSVATPTPVTIDALAATLPGVDATGGALALPLAVEVENWIVWFRPEQIEHVVWGQNRPDTDVPADWEDRQTIRLSPAGSFATWSQTVAGRGRPFSAAEIDAAMALRAALGSFVLKRSEQLATTVAALHAANAELDRFAYVAAHDLKEPLRGIFNYSDLIAEDLVETQPETRVALDAVRRLSSTMASLVDSLLDYATVGRADLHTERVELAEAVDDARELVSMRIEDVGGRLEVNSTATVWADRTQLVQVFTNVFSNALKYNEQPTPTVLIDVIGLGDTEQGWERWPQHDITSSPPTVIRCRDNGIGIDPEKAEAVFEVFRRLHARDRFGGGTGAGLTIARRIAERHGGRLWVEPAPGGGSDFLLALPSASQVPDDEQ